MRATDYSLMSYLIFNLGNRSYGFRMDDVHSISQPGKILLLKHAPSFCKGYMHYRGIILPIIDLKLCMSLSVADDTFNSCVLVINLEIEGQALLVGVLVDNVHSVIEFGGKDFDPIQKLRKPFVFGKVSYMGKNIHLIDPQILMSPAQVYQLSSSISYESKVKRIKTI